VLFLEEKKSVNNNIIIENRKKFTVTGVKDVISFDEETVVTETFLGKLVLKVRDFIFRILIPLLTI